jgi:hypothetical protein
MQTSLVLRPDDNLNATVELLFFDRKVSGDDQARLPIPLGLDEIWLDPHILYEPFSNRFRSPLAQIHIVLVRTERVGMPLDFEDRLWIPLNEAAQFLKARSSARSQDRGVVIKKKIGRHENRRRPIAELPGSG